MYDEDVEAWGHPQSKTQSKTQKQKQAEARLANLHEERKRKKFWDDFRRREERFQSCQTSGRDYKATARDFFTRSFTKGFRRSNTGGPQMRNTNMRHAVLGSTDGFKRGLSHSHGQPVPEQTLRRAFREIDADQDGLISIRELTRALRRCGVDASKKTVERILQDCGYDVAGQLSAEQFIRFFRATERLVWSVDDEYNPVDSCCTHCGRFVLFLLLIGVLVLSIILLRIETGTELFVALLLSWIAVMIAFFTLMIPVICLPLRRALRLGQQRRLKEQAAIDAIRAREAKPQAVKRAKTAQGPKSGLTWLEDLGRGPPAIRGTRSEPQTVSHTEVEAYNPEQYRVAQDTAARVPRKGGIPSAWSGAFSTDALEDDEKLPGRNRPRGRPMIKQPSIWQQPTQPQPHQVPPQQPQLQGTLELLQAELQPARGRAPPSWPPPETKKAKKEKESVSDMVMTDCD